MKRCPSCDEENADRARFCQACATPLPEPEETSGDGTRGSVPAMARVRDRLASLVE
jgi:hypothetical protein